MQHDDSISLRIDVSDLLSVIPHLLENHHMMALLRTGWNVRKGKRIALVRSAESFAPLDSNVLEWLSDCGVILLLLSPDPCVDAEKALSGFPNYLKGRKELGILAIGTGAAQGTFSGWFRPSWKKTVVPINEIVIVGAGEKSEAAVQIRREPDMDFVSASSVAEEIIRYSRTAGALGMRTLKTLRDLVITVAGAGRLGTLIINSLVRLGVGKIWIVDPDRVEIHNIDACDCLTLKDIGASKAEAAAWNTARELFTGDSDGPVLIPVPQLLNSKAALEAAKSSDILITALDQDSPRLMASFLSKIYLLPHIDVATGILNAGGKEREMGADIRFFLPNDRCILCMGGLPELTHLENERGNTAGVSMNDSTSRRFFSDPREEKKFLRERRWSDERSGSLRSLNQIAAHMALRMLEDMAAGMVLNSRWSRIDFDREGFMNVRHIDSRLKVTRCLCSRKGEGDRALALLESDEWEKLCRCEE
ncbi:MAG: ThiF family adenylyltransferase [Candidatus Xenobiia bacterium LiM19]